MDAIITIFMLLLTFPLVSLFHEWGHVFSAKLLGMKVKRIHLGTGYPLSKWKQGNIEVQYNWNCFLGGFNVIDNEESYPRISRLIVILSGQIVSFTLYFIGWELYNRLPLTASPLLQNWLYIFTVMNLYMGVVQLFPFRKGISRTNLGYPSDGLALIHLVTQRSQVPPYAPAQKSGNNEKHSTHIFNIKRRKGRK